MESPDQYILAVLQQLIEALPSEYSLFADCIGMVETLPSNQEATDYRFNQSNRYASGGMSGGDPYSSSLYRLSQNHPDYRKQLTDVAAYLAMTGSSN